jgi:signal transduction histidine kinase/CheY-like chemotaxis protein
MPADELARQLQQSQQALQALRQQHVALQMQMGERAAGLEAALALAEQRRQEAERANAAKSRFLAHMSHEIRTPLNGVLGLTELALRSAHSPDQRRYLSVAHQAGQTLLRVISEVLDFSRIESGRVDLRAQPFDAAELLAEALRGVMPLAHQRALLLLYDWIGDNPLLLGDEGSLRQVLTNLLGNALKFTAQGQVVLCAEARPAGPGHMALRIQVSDTGPGVPPAMRERIFDAFQQGDDSLSRHHGGTGLGLTIAKRLSDAMGGELQLDCPPGGGSTFTLGLRLPLAGAAARPLAPSLPDPHPGQGRLAWVVYASSPNGEWLARRLARLGWQCRTLGGLAEAVAQAQGLAGANTGPLPDLVLVAEPALVQGADLPGLRAALPQATIHLVIRPDWHDPVLEVPCAALDISALVAPLTPSMLQQLGVHAADGEPRPSAPGAPLPPLRADARVLLVEDNPVNQLVGQAFLKALGLQVQLAADGLEALAACTRQPPDLVLMDLQMPGMDGLEATSRLQALQREGRWPGAPILALTAHATDADRAACRAAGMSAVLTKPLSLEGLHRQLGRWIPA